MTGLADSNPDKRLIGRLLCRLNRHDWHHWEGGHVYAGDDWDGPWHAGHPWAFGFTECRRCKRRRR